jgi:hypothetical protein
MTLSLYDISVPSYLQTLNAASRFLEKGRLHFIDQGVDLAEIVEAQIHPDMRPLRFQVQHLAFHSRGAIDAILGGKVSYPGPRTALDYEGLQTLVAETAESLARLDLEAINARAGTDMVWNTPGAAQRIFTAEGFLMSFSLPNFYFHAATAYDILRGRGAPLGKLDYMGALRLKQA